MNWDQFGCSILQTVGCPGAHWFPRMFLKSSLRDKTEILDTQSPSPLICSPATGLHWSGYTYVGNHALTLQLCSMSRMACGMVTATKAYTMTLPLSKVHMWLFTFKNVSKSHMQRNKETPRLRLQVDICHHNIPTVQLRSAGFGLHPFLLQLALILPSGTKCWSQL